MAERSLFVASWVATKVGLLRHRCPVAPVRRILVIKLDHLGDTIMSLPVLASLRATYPEALITMLVGPWMRELAEGLCLGDRILSFAAKQFIRNGHQSRAQSYHDLSDLLDAESFDLVVNLRGDWVTLLWGVRNRPSAFLDYGATVVEDLAHRRAPPHLVDRNLRVLESVGIPAALRDCRLECDSIWAKAVSHEVNIVADNGPFFVVHPGASTADKRWPPERFAKLITEVVAELEFQPIIVGTKEELPLVRCIQAHCEPPSVNMCGKLSLLELGALVSKAIFFVGNDSGPLHYACALGTPSVGIYARPTMRYRYQPHGQGHSQCVYGDSVTVIPVDEVLAAIRSTAKLAGGKSTPRIVRLNQHDRTRDR